MNDVTRESLVGLFVRATGRSDCTNVVILHRRPRWAIPLAVAIAFGVIAVVQAMFNLGSLINTIILVVIGAITFTAIDSDYWLGRCGESAVLVRVAGKPSSSHVVVGEWLDPVPAKVDRGLVAKRVSVDGESYVVDRHFLHDFRAIIGAE